MPDVNPVWHVCVPDRNGSLQLSPFYFNEKNNNNLLDQLIPTMVMSSISKGYASTLQGLQGNVIYFHDDI